jgi:hypothetical protein
MSSIIIRGDSYHGICVDGRGVFTDDKWGGRTYAGQCKDGYACGLGVATWSNGTKAYAEYGPDGQCDGRCLYRWAGGNTFYYLYERGGKPKEYVVMYADGRCTYNNEACAPDDPRLLALIALVAPVEVRPEAPAPLPPLARPLAPSNRPKAIVRWIGRLVLPLQALATAVATEVHTQHRTPSLVVARHNPTAAALPKQDHTVTGARAVLVAREAFPCTH